MNHQQMPQENAGKANDTQNAAQHKPGKDLAAHHTPPVPDGNFSQRHGLNDQGGSLGSAVAAAGHDQGNKICQDQYLGQFIIVIGHGGCRKHFTEKKNDQPAHPFADQLEKRRFQVRMIQGFGAPDLLNIFR